MFSSPIVGRVAPTGWKKNIPGDTYNQLTLVSEVESSHSPTMKKWLCKCSCGVELHVVLMNIRRSHSKSCGCNRVESFKKAITLPRLPTEIDGRIAKVHLGRDKWTTLLAEHLPIVENYVWGCHDGYAVTGHGLRMHRLLCQCQTGQNPDHIDGNGLNNIFAPGEQINNLRAATVGQNATNTRLRLDNTSGFKGASWNKAMNKWASQIQHQRKKIHLGFFDTAEDAHSAYCKAAQRLHGEFVRALGPEFGDPLL